MQLSSELSSKLSQMFELKKGFGRFLIPIGVHELTCVKAEWRFTSNGRRMLYAELWKKPSIPNYRIEEKISFGKIKLYHIQGNGNEPAKDRWFNTFTTDIDPIELEKLYRRLSVKPMFKAVVGIVEESFVTGEYIKATKTGYRNFIRSVHRLDDPVTLTNNDYFDLYRVPFREYELKEETVVCPF